MFGVLSGLARESGWASENVDDADARASDDATEATDCTNCPVCRAIHAVQQLSPEVKEHLSSAGTSLAHAAAAILTTHVTDDRHTTPDDQGSDIEFSEDR